MSDRHPLGWRVVAQLSAQAGRTSLVLRDSTSALIGVLHVRNEEVTEAKSLLAETWMRVCGECAVALDCPEKRERAASSIPSESDPFAPYPGE